MCFQKVEASKIPRISNSFFHHCVLLEQAGTTVFAGRSCVPKAATKYLLDFFHFPTDILEQGIAWAPFCSAPLGLTEREVDDYYDLS